MIKYDIELIEITNFTPQNSHFKIKQKVSSNFLWNCRSLWIYTLGIGDWLLGISFVELNRLSNL